jgi:LDH2 family malate/lactate/ureidoglycolate dehydrogenase
MKHPRYRPEYLLSFAGRVLRSAGLPDEPADSVAEGLVEADLLGHTTHGLALLANYVEELACGRMEREGRPTVLAETPAAATWDARRLPGVWTTHLAVRDAESRARACGVGAVAIQRSHHIACLAAFLEAPARRNVLVLIFSSDPAGAHVAPFGGLTPVLTPNPIAAGIPATPDPILIDVSTSITTVALCARMLAAGAPLPGPWLLDRDGSPTDDPKAVTAGGALLPVGGLDHGHKGYGLSLIVAALTQGLGGYGRADEPRGWGASVFVLALCPEMFGGEAAFLRQTDRIAELCRAARTLQGQPGVRLPGEAGLAHKKHALAAGMPLCVSACDSLRKCGERFGLEPPTPL